MSCVIYTCGVDHFRRGSLLTFECTKFNLAFLVDFGVTLIKFRIALSFSLIFLFYWLMSFGFATDNFSRLILV
jgi:hypothetical protein